MEVEFLDMGLLFIILVLVLSVIFILPCIVVVNLTFDYTKKPSTKDGIILAIKVGSSLAIAFTVILLFK